MDLSEFLLREFRKKNFDKEVWVPLRVSLNETKGSFGSEGYVSTFYGATSVAVPVEKIDIAGTELNWHSIGLIHDHSGYVQNSVYHPAELHEFEGFTGLNLVICQRSSNGEPSVWHLHPDLVTTLNLRPEGSVWLAVEEGYAEVIRYSEDADRHPRKMEIRADFLKDYLSGRGMALRISFYAEREVNVKTLEGTDWSAFDAEDSGPIKQTAKIGSFEPMEWNTELPDGRWQGRVIAIHEGGHPVGSGFAVFHAGRKDFDAEQSVPEISHLDEMESSEHHGQFSGPIVFRVFGEIWRDQWVRPAALSVRVRGDDHPPTCFYIVDAEGNRKSSDQLKGGMRWLWFSPAAVKVSLSYRGASLQWYTRETGRISMAKDGGVVFGVNNLGLVNVYAKDVAYMPLWQQKIWSGFNVAPDGGVSKELLASQAKGVPSDTHAPEAFLVKGRDALNQAVLTACGVAAFRCDAKVVEIMASCHRFRALDRTGLLELAKDLSRVTADDIDAKQLQKIVPLEPGEKRGSLKSLERVIGKLTAERYAAVAMSALFAIYDLRLADAHLPSSTTDSDFQRLDIDPKLPYVLQGRDMLIALVDALFIMARAVGRASKAAKTPSDT
jgi:hypothetical protein